MLKLAKFQATIETAMNLMQATLNDLGKSTAKAYFEKGVDPFDALGQMLFSSFVKLHKFQGADEAKRFAHLASDAMEASAAMTKSNLQQQSLGKHIQLLLRFSQGLEVDRMHQMLDDEGLHPELPFSWQSGYAPWRT